MGLIGKAGVILAGGLPIAWAAVDALRPWTDATWAPVDISGKLKGSLALFANDLTQGFGVGSAFPGGVGAVVPGVAVDATVFSGTWLKTTSAGIGLVVIDGVIGIITRFAAGGRVRPKVMGRQLISG